MSTFLLRTFTFLVMPLLFATAATLLDKKANTRERRIEIFLIYMFAFGAISGISNFFGHIFAADEVAAAIGWEAGSPFQLEMAFANLSYGVLAIICMGRRDGFRDATVIGSAILSVGATLVHLWDIAETGNLAPGNTVQNVVNLGRPAILIWLLLASHRLERAPGVRKRSADFRPLAGQPDSRRRPNFRGRRHWAGRRVDDRDGADRAGHRHSGGHRNRSLFPATVKRPKLARGDWRLEIGDWLHLDSGGASRRSPTARLQSQFTPVSPPPPLAQSRPNLIRHPRRWLPTTRR
ncbi:MAG: hypothetical protein HC802_07790 [Caldilineaceae bacterium]|nr:hypothetical protein [Caldilineaceae bacterium]